MVTKADVIRVKTELKNEISELKGDVRELKDRTEILYAVGAWTIIYYECSYIYKIIFINAPKS